MTSYIGRKKYVSSDLEFKTAFPEMEQLAFAVNNAVSDELLRNMHILCGIAV